MKVTVVVDNTVALAAPLIGEHGFSALVEGDGTRLLFDTGRGDALAANLERLSIPREPLTSIVLSHGHNDHTGGLAAAVEWFGPTEIIAHCDLFADHRLRREGGDRPIGIPFPRERLEALGCRLRLVEGFSGIGRGFWVTGEVPRRNDFEVGDPALVAGDGVRDPLKDDLSLVAETPGGIVVLLGCAHAGIINIVSHVVAHFPGVPLAAVVGGTHLGLVPPAQLDATIDALKAFDIPLLGMSHCTGAAAGARLAAAFPGRVFFATAGTSLTF